VEGSNPERFKGLGLIVIKISSDSGATSSRLAVRFINFTCENEPFSTRNTSSAWMVIQPLLKVLSDVLGSSKHSRFEAISLNHFREDTISSLETASHVQVCVTVESREHHSYWQLFSKTQEYQVTVHDGFNSMEKVRSKHGTDYKLTP
jgi:hypothetical protein